MSCYTADMIIKETIDDEFKIADSERLLEEMQRHAFLTRNKEEIVVLN